MLAPKAEQLAPAEAAEGGHAHQGPVPGFDGGGEVEDLLDGGQAALLGPFGASAADGAGVGDQDAVLDGGVEDRPQEPVALRCRAGTGPGADEPGVPGPHLRRPDPPQLHVPERGEDVEPELAFIQLPHPRSQRDAATTETGGEPLAGVGGECGRAAVGPHPPAAGLIGDGRRQGVLGVAPRPIGPEAHPLPGGLVHDPGAVAPRLQAVDPAQLTTLPWHARPPPAPVGADR